MKKLYVTFLVIILTMTTMIPTGIANANSTVGVSGEYEITLTSVECVNSACSQLVSTVCISYESTYDGNLIGTAQECFNYALNVISNPTNNTGKKTFTGTVLGKEGTYTAYVRHQSLGNGDLKIEETIISGTDELANIQGTFVFMVTKTDPGVWEGTYSGNVSFAD